MFKTTTLIKLICWFEYASADAGCHYSVIHLLVLYIRIPILKIVTNCFRNFELENLFISLFLPVHVIVSHNRPSFNDLAVCNNSDTAKTMKIIHICTSISFNKIYKKRLQYPANAFTYYTLLWFSYCQPPPNERYNSNLASL